MSLTESDIRHIARLARLHVSEEEARRLSEDLTGILEFIDRIEAGEGSGQPPVRPVDDSGEDRVDRPRSERSTGKLADAAPETERGFVRVPPVFGAEDSSADEESSSHPSPGQSE